jgi:hypothetical protein
VTGGITGSIFGTSSNATSASYALNSTNASTASYALTASYAVSASYEINYETSSSYANEATSASYALSSSYALNAASASYGLSSSYALDSTNAITATSASYALNSTNAATTTSASYALNSTNAATTTSASYADNSLTASYALNSPGGGGTTDTGSLLLTASVTDNVITFTKGDASTFNITVNTGSASSINTGSFATTGSNQFNGSQGITGSVTIADNDLSLAMSQNFIVFENLNSPNDIGIITRLGSTYSEGGNTQAFLFPSSPTGGYKTITLPNDTGTVALTYNTATTGSNTFRGNQTISGSALISGSIILSGSNAGIVQTTTVRYNNVEVNNPTPGYGYSAKLYSEYLVFDDSGLVQTYFGNNNISKTVGLNTQNINFPDNPTGGIKTIYFPNDTGTVALTYNTATTGSNIFSGSQTITGSLNVSGSSTFIGNQIVTGSLIATSEFSPEAVTTVEGANIKVENTSTLGYVETQPDLLRFTKNASGLKSLNLKQAITPSANRTIYFPDEDGTIAMKGANTFTGNQIVTGSVSITSVLTLAPNDPLPSAQPTGSISVSGSGADCKPYFWNGTTWTSLI